MTEAKPATAPQELPNVSELKELITWDFRTWIETKRNIWIDTQTRDAMTDRDERNEFNNELSRLKGSNVGRYKDLLRRIIEYVLCLGEEATFRELFISLERENGDVIGGPFEVDPERYIEMLKEDVLEGLRVIEQKQAIADTPEVADITIEQRARIHQVVAEYMQEFNI